MAGTYEEDQLRPAEKRNHLLLLQLHPSALQVALEAGPTPAELKTGLGTAFFPVQNVPFFPVL